MDNFANALFLVFLLIMVGWGYFSDRGKVRHSLRNALIWLLVIGGATAGAIWWEGWRYDTQVVMQEGVYEIRIPQNITGEYRTDIVVNDQIINTVVDTGASQLFLSQKDALALGIELEKLNYYGNAMTANGAVRIAKIKLDRVSIGKTEFRDVVAFISNGAQDETLLGMGVLDKFQSVAIENNILTLRP